MTADGPNFKDWTIRVAELLRVANDLDQLPEALLQAMEFLSPVAHSSIVIYRTGRRPFDLWTHPAGVSPSLYHAGLYELDPFFAAFTEGRSGCISLRAVAPSGFEQSEFYRQFYASQGYVDGLVHMTRLDEGGMVLAACNSAEPMTKEEIQRHTDAHPVIAACSVHVARLALAKAGDRQDVLDSSVDGALARFGVEVLTPREQQVIHLILRGHSTESAGGQLGISWNTVKRHRLQAYAKLGVGSQGELFYQFLRSIGLEPDKSDK